jgi:chitodextrinase
MCAIFALFSFPALAAGPDRIMDLTAVPTNGGVRLTWTAPAAAAMLATMDVRYNTASITALNWANCSQVVWLTTPGVSGVVQNAIVTGLVPGTKYYFAMKVRDLNGNWSTIPSNVASAIAGNTNYTLFLSWEPSISSSASTYILHIRTEGQSQDINLPNITTVGVNGIQFDATYTFTVSCVDAQGNESDVTNEIHDDGTSGFDPGADKTVLVDTKSDGTEVDLISFDPATGAKYAKKYPNANYIAIDLFSITKNSQGNDGMGASPGIDYPLRPTNLRVRGKSF